jgi:hypothetical protein
MAHSKIVKARILKGTTLAGEKRFRIVKEGEVLELDWETFVVLKSQGQAEEIIGAAPAAKAKITDSAGNQVATR